jgi:hypothetical protein
LQLLKYTGQYRSKRPSNSKTSTDYQRCVTRTYKEAEAGISGRNETLQQMNQRKSDLENQAGELMNEWQQDQTGGNKTTRNDGRSQCTKAAIGKESRRSHDTTI